MHRPIASVSVLAVFLSACSFFGAGEDVSKTRSNFIALAPAGMPTYGTGDSYTYDNPKETWTVVHIADDLLHWRSSLGSSQMTVFDPLLPPIEWIFADKSRATRKFITWDGNMFPLRPGSKMTYTEIVRSWDRVRPIKYMWRCSAGNPDQVRVPAGQFAAYPILCQRDDGYKAQGHYAPAINKAIAIAYFEPNGRMDVRNLLSFSLGEGRRVAAREQKSLPRGWSEVLVDRLAPYTGVAAHDKMQPTASPRVPVRQEPIGAIASTKTDARASAMPSLRAVLGVGQDSRAAAVTSNSLTPAGGAVPGNGRYLVQLSSLTSPVYARKEWARLRRVYSELFGGKELVLEKRKIAGRGTFYRVQTGRYETLNEARSVCATLKAKNQECLAIRR